MSDLLLALLLLVPIVIVVVILNYTSRKRRKNDRARIMEYIVTVARRTGIACDYQHHLIHQTVIIDEKSRMLLIIDHAQAVFSYDEYTLDEIREMRVEHQKHVVMPEGKDKRKEHIVTKIGLELIIGKDRKNKFLTVYDHLEHNIHQLKDLEKDANGLLTRIEKAGRVKPVVV